MKIVLVVLALILVIATALPLLHFDKWWIRVLDFPRAQWRRPRLFGTDQLM